MYPMRSKLFRPKLLLVLPFVTLAGCQAVKPYEAQLLQDEYMQPNALAIEKLEAEAESFREASSGGMGGKTGGGCGCN